jgi:hypothetical protein
MRSRVQKGLACALLACLPGGAADIAILQLQVIEGGRRGADRRRPLDATDHDPSDR